MDTGRIGRRIAYWRNRRGFTQTDFGRLMGQTKRWVQDLEGGKRQSDPRLSVLMRTAEALRIPLEELLSDAPLPVADEGAPPEAGAIIDALYRTPEPDAPPPSLTDVQRRLVYCCEAFQASHYGALGRALPALIVMSQAAADGSSGGGGAFVLLSRSLQLAASFLHKYGKATAIPAAVVADRALAAAERSGDPVAIGAAARRVAKSLTYQQQPFAAVEFALAAAGRLSSDLQASGPLGLSTLGMLYLNAAIAASNVQRSTEAVRTTGYVDEAADIAEQQGADLNEDWTAFGPTNVKMHRVDVLTRFADGWSALDAGVDLDSNALTALTHERQAQHHITMARAQLLTRHKEAAAKSLQAAASLASEEVCGRPTTISLVKDVVGATAAPDSGLRALAERCGLRT